MKTYEVNFNVVRNVGKERHEILLDVTVDADNQSDACKKAQLRIRTFLKSNINDIRINGAREI